MYQLAVDVSVRLEEEREGEKGGHLALFKLIQSLNVRAELTELVYLCKYQQMTNFSPQRKSKPFRGNNQNYQNC